MDSAVSGLYHIRLRPYGYNTTTVLVKLTIIYMMSPSSFSHLNAGELVWEKTLVTRNGHGIVGIALKFKY